MNRDLNQTYRYPANNSVSKQLYSFPKAHRFQTDAQPLCKNAFYEIKNGAFGKRTTTFGYGNKMNIVNREQGPPAGKYDINGDFVLNKQKNKGYSFSKKSKVDTLINPQQTAKIPGPGAYQHKRMRSFDKYSTFSYSMGPKLEDPLEKHKNNLGPGQYETIPSINSKGQYFISNYVNSGCGIIGKSKRPTLNSNSIAPGPGNYQGEAKINLNKTGVYFNSKYRNMEAGKFGKSNRPQLADLKPVPGPGSYSKGDFSQFAILNKSWNRSATLTK